MVAKESEPSIAIGFPGQGAHDPAKMERLMREFPSTLDVVIEAEDVLKRHLLHLLIRETSPDATTREDQIRLYIGGVALWKVANEEALIPEGVRKIFYGSSAGELTALHAGGAYDFATGLELIDARGIEMHKATIINPGEMLVASGLPFDEAMNLAANFPGVKAVNDNPGSQTVFSGTHSAIERIEEHLKRAMPNVRPHRPNIKGAAHSIHMQPAIEGLRNAARRAKMRQPLHDFMSNQAELLQSVRDIQQHLVEQLTRGVRLRESANQLYNDYNVRVFYDLGLIKVLSGLMKREFRKKVEIVPVVDELLPEKSE